MLGGQGGSGKSSIHEYLSADIGNIVSIDGDLFRREHPNYEMIQKIYGKDAANITQSFANNITNAMIEKLSDEGYNLVIEGTCRRADVPLKTCGDLKEKGYRVELAIMCTDKEEAWQSTLDRAEKMRELGLSPREVPKEKYQETIFALPGNVSILYQSGAFDDITLFNRQLEELYKFSRTPEHDPADIFITVCTADPMNYTVHAAAILWLFCFMQTAWTKPGLILSTTSMSLRMESSLMKASSNSAARLPDVRFRI